MTLHERSIYILNIAADYLEKKCEPMLSETMEWDGTECDGACLVDDLRDIATALSFEKEKQAEGPTDAP